MASGTCAGQPVCLEVELEEPRRCDANSRILSWPSLPLEVALSYSKPGDRVGPLLGIELLRLLWAVSVPPAAVGSLGCPNSVASPNCLTAFAAVAGFTPNMEGRPSGWQ